VTIDDSSTFTNFILDSRITSLRIPRADARIQAVFDEEFVRKFSLIEGRSYHLSARHPNIHGPQWTPSRDVLPVICRYSDLVLPTLTLSVEMLKELITVRIIRQMESRLT
ncbi:hypothetical protein PENTCL1PPCAC_324, partial [Pristionchus entomophagus]